MIIIPDIHGRSFWRKALEVREAGEKIVFLGDYLDNYPGEVDSYTGTVITPDTALHNFKEIIKFAKADDNTVLLLGNHDCEYLFNECPACRCDTKNFDEIRGIFNDNIKMFSISHIHKESGHDFLLSHAGINEKHAYYFLEFYANLEHRLSDEERKSILDKELTYEDIISIAETINSAFVERPFWIGSYLGHVGYSRGGRGTGSIVWADYYEGLDVMETGPFQIVGHSQYNAPGDDEFAAGPNSINLDCRAAFRLYSTEGCEEIDIRPITKVTKAVYDRSY